MAPVRDCRENYMNINDVVAHALHMRANQPWFTRMSLDAYADRNEVILTVYPFNGKFVESSIGAYKLYIHDDKLQMIWM